MCAAVRQLSDPNRPQLPIDHDHEHHRGTAIDDWRENARGKGRTDALVGAACMVQRNTLQGLSNALSAHLLLMLPSAVLMVLACGRLLALLLRLTCCLRLRIMLLTLRLPIFLPRRLLLLAICLLRLLILLPVRLLLTLSFLP